MHSLHSLHEIMNLLAVVTLPISETITIQFLVQFPRDTVSFPCQMRIAMSIVIDKHVTLIYLRKEARNRHIRTTFRPICSPFNVLYIADAYLLK